MATARELIEQGIRYETGGVLERALGAYREAAAAADSDTRAHAEALRREADVLRSRCAWDESLHAARASASIALDAGHDDLVAEALNAEAAVFQSRGQLPHAVELYEKMLQVTRDQRIRGIALQNLGSIAATEGDFARAEECFVESFECFQRGGYTRGVVFSLNNYGRAALDRGATDVAHPVLVRAEAVARDLMDLDLLALVRLNLAECLLRRSEVAGAEELASAALGYFGTTQNHWRRVECLRLMGDIALVQQRAESARNFFEAAFRLAQQVDAGIELRKLQERLDEMSG
jgi:tetratricopeptide (TPR) repeat protein